VHFVSWGALTHFPCKLRLKIFHRPGGAGAPTARYTYGSEPQLNNILFVCLTMSSLFYSLTFRSLRSIIYMMCRSTLNVVRRQYSILLFGNISERKTGCISCNKI